MPFDDDSSATPDPSARDNHTSEDETAPLSAPSHTLSAIQEQPQSSSGAPSHPSHPAASAPSNGRHNRSASTASSSAGIAIPSRSSSVMMASAPGFVPARSSSIASPTKPGLSTSASDLADTIAGLKLADDDTTTDTSTAITPKPASRPFGVPVTGSNGPSSPIRSPRSPKPADSPGRQSASGFGLGFGDQASLAEVSEQIGDATQAIEDIRRHMFVFQEKRHAGMASNALDQSTDSANRDGSGQAVPASELELSLMQLDEKLEAASRTMQQLEVRVGEICGEDDDLDPDSSIVDKEMIDWNRRNRRGSIGSIGSLTSFDELMLPSFAPALSPRTLKPRYDELVEDWAKVQQEAESLKKELGDDKYLIVFRSVSEQAESMMDSLDKAIAHCNSFITDFQRDHRDGLIRPAADAESADTSDSFAEENDPGTKLAELAELKKTFIVKRSHYTPACEQVFTVLERGTRERGASNGTILRKLADLKSRWRHLREAVSRTEKEMKRIEITLKRLQAGHSESSADGSDAVSPTLAVKGLPGLSDSKHLHQAALGQGSPARPRLTPKSTLRSSPAAGTAALPSIGSPAGHRIASGPSRLSSSSSVGSNLSSTPPAPPPKSRLRRVSATAESLGLQTQPIASASPRGSSRTVDTPSKTLRLQRSQPFGLSSSQPKESPLSSNRYHNRSNSAAFPQTGNTLAWPKIKVGGSPPDSRSGTGRVAAPPPSSYRGSLLGLDSHSSRSRSKSPLPPTASATAVTTTPSRPSRPSSRTGMTGAPATPSRNGRAVEDEDSDAVETMMSSSSPTRPGSSMGQYYRPPSAQGTVGSSEGARKRDSMIPRLTLRGDGSSASPARPGSAMSQASNTSFTTGTPPRYTGASRLSMQTPEPTIMARVQRLSMYARAPSSGVGGMGTPGKRSSRPPPTRLNGSVLTPAGRNTSGRTTPLSAAALASLPNASGTGLRTGARMGVSGRTTPTPSETGSIGGMSSMTWRIGSGSIAGSDVGGRTGGMYKPNPNDALDVHVAAIANGLGVSLERLDPPLPRGMRLEEGPGKDNRTKYEIGGKVVMCRLLELHRPAGSAGARAGTKAKKILVRVGGGWQDLEQWLLNLLGQQ